MARSVFINRKERTLASSSVRSFKKQTGKSRAFVRLCIRSLTDKTGFPNCEIIASKLFRKLQKCVSKIRICGDRLGRNCGRMKTSPMGGRIYRWGSRWSCISYRLMWRAVWIRKEEVDEKNEFEEGLYGRSCCSDGGATCSRWLV